MTKQVVFLVCLSLLLLVENCLSECEDYSPCICAEDEIGQLTVNCLDVQPADIKTAFSRTTALTIFNLVILLPADSDPLPSDLLSGKTASIINIIGSGRESFELDIAVDTFSSSSSTTGQFTILNCNLYKLNFSFLRGFSKLVELRLDSTANISTIQTLPSLPSLTGLAIDNSIGFNDLTGFPSKGLSRLQRLYLFNDELDDYATDIILNAFLDSSSLNTLRFLALGENRLTKVPPQIPLFTSLADLSLNQNSIHFVESNQIAFGAPKVENLLLRYNFMQSIQPGAFIGDFSNAQVVLDHNVLTDFPADVFQGMLERMATGNGTVILDSNPFDCECNLAWLVRDNRHLLRPLSGATCSNGTLFEQLDPAGLSNC